MNQSWYKKIMPKISDVQKDIGAIAKEIYDIEKVKSVLVWGSFARNLTKPNFPLRDIDIIAVTDILSDDLLSIIEDDTFSPLRMDREELESDGFSVSAVSFTKNFIKDRKYNLDYWTISSDEKLLHWGAITSSKEEWGEIQKSAEKYAYNLSGIDRKKLIRANKSKKETWYLSYKKHVEKLFENIPNGWFQSENNISDILKETKILI